MAGDFNGTVNNELDRSKARKKKNKSQEMGKLPNIFFKLVEQENLIDIWRKRNKKGEIIHSIQTSMVRGPGLI